MGRIDAGKASHHAAAVDVGGKRLWSVKVASDQQQIEELITRAADSGAEVRWAVDLVSPAAALLLAILLSAGRTPSTHRAGPAGDGERVKVVAGSVGDLGSSIAVNDYDVVLCLGVLTYLPEGRPAITGLAKYGRAGACSWGGPWEGSSWLLDCDSAGCFGLSACMTPRRTRPAATARLVTNRTVVGVLVLGRVTSSGSYRLVDEDHGVLFHSACLRVAETTYLGMLFMLSAKPNSSAGIDGHALANPSYATRPRSSTLAALISSSLIGGGLRAFCFP